MILFLNTLNAIRCFLRLTTLILLFLPSHFSLDSHNATVDLFEIITHLVEVALHPWPVITQKAVNEIRKPMGFRVQRVQGEWWISDEPRHRYESRNMAMKVALLGLQQYYSSDLPDGLDFVIDTSDGMENIGPIFAFCRYAVGNNKIAIPIPDFTFTGWPEVGQVSYWSVIQSIKAARDQVKDSGADKAFFIGRMGGRRDKLLSGFDAKFVEAQVHQFGGRTEGVKLRQGGNYISIADHCKQKYLLHLPGGGSYSSRLKYLLFCNSTVIILEEFNSTGGSIQPLVTEWYYPALIPWKHYIPCNNGTELNYIVQQLRANANLAATIAKQGTELVDVLLRPDTVALYWCKLLSAYAAKMDYRVTVPAPGAVSLTNWAMQKLV